MESCQAYDECGLEVEGCRDAFGLKMFHGEMLVIYVWHSHVAVLGRVVIKTI